jgi:Na+-transporting methylmalonyl-CoA/oxaloacetate decarboxylase gamma subunit
MGSGFARADGDMFSISPSSPISGKPMLIYLNDTTLSLATISIENASGIIWSETIGFVNGSAVIGPISLSAGNYTLNAVLWQVNSTTGDFTTSVATLDFTVSLPIAEPEKYTPIQVIIVGISFVFLVLGVLAMFTFLSGRLLPQEAPKPVVTTPSDEGERIAAIAAVIKLRGK